MPCKEWRPLGTLRVIVRRGCPGCWVLSTEPPTPSKSDSGGTLSRGPRGPVPQSTRRSHGRPGKQVFGNLINGSHNIQTQ